jgi:hypothetical protein
LLNTPRERLAAGAHFLENHDEPRIASLLPLSEHRAAVVVTLSLPGMRFLHDGQLGGALRRVPVQLARQAVEPVRPAINSMYEQILSAQASSSVGRGSAELLRPNSAWADNPTEKNFVIIQWRTQPPDFDLVVVNLAPHRSQCYAPLSVPDLSVCDWNLRDVLGTERFVRHGEELKSKGLYLDLPAHGSQLFHFQPV